jgi:glutamyl-tRNA synthetase
VPDDQLAYDDKAVEKRLRKEGAIDLLTKFRAVLSDVEPFDPEPLEAAMKQFIEDEGVKIGEIIHPVRVATTGKQTGIGMFDALALLGRESCLRRIDRALELG